MTNAQPLCLRVHKLHTIAANRHREYSLVSNLNLQAPSAQTETK